MILPQKFTIIFSGVYESTSRKFTEIDQLVIDLHEILNCFVFITFLTLVLLELPKISRLARFSSCLHFPRMVKYAADFQKVIFARMRWCKTTAFMHIAVRFQHGISDKAPDISILNSSPVFLRLKTTSLYYEERHQSLWVYTAPVEEGTPSRN